MLNIFKVPSYSGKSSYKYVNDLIDGGRKVMIVSPYIDIYYANFLISRSRTRKFYVLSSSMDSRARKVLLKGRFPREAATFTSIFYLGFLLFYLTGFYSFSGSMLLVAVVSTIVSFLFLRGAPKNISVRFPKDFVHAKMYISERMAIRGSANLTYKGMHQNVEHIDISYEREEIERLERDFWQLWGSS
ncbi:MAG: hypothetical protein KGH78_02435 [Candidatus Micrarchaeota archaeon]|nr:hypothetical protein [Candidatus Micrarchaeota archaeon]